MIDEEQRQHELIYFSGIMVETHVPSHLRFHLLLATRRRLMYVYNCVHKRSKSVIAIVAFTTAFAC